MKGTILFGLYLLPILAMIGLRYQFAQSESRQTVKGIMLTLAFSTILTLIADLDRTTEGAIILNHQPIIEYYQVMNS
jgi:hypothetical protein